MLSGHKLAALFGVMALAAPVFAHHSFSAEFDREQRVTFTGTVTKVDWANPHTYFYVDVKDKGGRTVNWIFEAGGPNLLFHLGWTRDSLKVGDHVTVVGFLPWSHDVRVASARVVVLADGRKVYAGTPKDGGPLP